MLRNIKDSIFLFNFECGRKNKQEIRIWNSFRRQSTGRTFMIFTFNTNKIVLFYDNLIINYSKLLQVSVLNAIISGTYFNRTIHTNKKTIVKN